MGVGSSTHVNLLIFVEATAINGVARTVFGFCRSLAALSDRGGVHVALATFRRGGAETSAFDRAAADVGVPVHVIHERFCFDPRVIGEIRRLVGRCGADVVETCSVKSHVLVRLSGAWRSRPWIACHHGYTTTDLKMRAYNQLDRWSLREACHVVTVSRASVDVLVRLGISRDHISVVHNAIDPSYGTATTGADVEAVRSRHGIEKGDRVLVSVGRLSREKGHVHLVDALDLLLRTTRMAVTLMLVGDGPERQALESRARNLGVLPRVVFAGRREDVAAYLRAADVFVLPSSSEGSPHALLEAAAAGIPIVASRVGGIPEMVSDADSALLVPPGAPGALADAIARILHDESLGRSLARSARGTLERQHSQQARTATLVNLYRHYAGSGPAARSRCTALDTVPQGRP